MELADLVSDAAEVEFFHVEMGFHEVADIADGFHDFVEPVRIEMMEVDGGFRGIGDDDDPWEAGVVFQIEMAAAQDADEWAGCGEAGMGSEVHEGLRWDGVVDGKGKSGVKRAGW